jgi:hypothetical protein
MGFEHQQGRIISNISKIFKTSSGAHEASYLMGTNTGALARGSDRDRLTTYLHLVMRLRITRLIPLLPLYA